MDAYSEELIQLVWCRWDPAIMNKLLGLLVVFAAIIVVASATYCKRPPYPKYGYHNGRHRYYPVGHKLTYWCKYGYSLYGYRYNYCVRRGHYYYWRYRTPVCSKTCMRSCYR